MTQPDLYIDRNEAPQAEIGEVTVGGREGLQ